jgi:hypothetical protein
VITLFSGGGISGVLTHPEVPDEHVLVLGFDEEGDPLVIGEDGRVRVTANYTELILDWRWVNGRWLTVEEIEAAKGAEQDVDEPI